MTNAETVNVEIRTLTDVRTDEPSSREQTKTDDAAKAPTGPNMSAITQSSANNCRFTCGECRKFKVVAYMVPVTRPPSVPCDRYPDIETLIFVYRSLILISVVLITSVSCGIS